MSYMSDREYAARMELIKKENLGKERELKLKKEKNKYGFKFKWPSTSKIVLLVTFLLCLQIVFFCERMMVETGDISALYVLIGVPVSLIPVTVGYMWKSKNENTTGGIVYETAMLEKAVQGNIVEPCDEANSEDSQC